MSVSPIPDLELEKLFKNLRRSFLSNISSLKEASPDLLRFQSALALQCFTNEYIYSNTREEEEYSFVRNQSKKRSEIINSKSRHHIGSSSYKALIEYDWCNLLVVTEDIKEVFTRQFTEPKYEEKIKKQIPILKEITDSISTEVKAQYEHNPYPRWVNSGLPWQCQSQKN